MAKIEDFVTAFNAFSDRQGIALAGIAADVASLKSQLDGNLTPEQQALLDGVLAKAQSAAESLEALDAQTP